MVSDVNYKEQQNYLQIINSIKKIEREIKRLYNSLEELSVNQNPDLKKQKQLISDIKYLQQLKESLYKNISYNYAATQSRLVESRNVLVDETAVTDIMANELKLTKKQLQVLENEKYNKARMADINNYYSSKYETNSNIIKTIIYYCVPILILGILIKNGLIPQNIGIGIITILCIIVIINVYFQVLDVMNRDNMIFDEYDFPFNPDDTHLSSVSNDADQPVKANWKLSCAGEACCPEGNTYGTVWDPINKQCVTPTYVKPQSEGFVGEKCLQSSFNKPCATVNVFNENDKVKSYNNNDSYTKF